MKSAILLVSLLFAPWLAQAGDFQISVAKKPGESVKGKAVPEGHRTKGEDKFFYQVTVVNRAFKPTPKVEARYILFVERQELGKKPGTEQVEKMKGIGSVKALEPRASDSFATDHVALRTQSLTGNWHYSDGGRIKAKDSLVGIWVKLFDGETEVGEYVNPSTLATKQKWEE